MKEVATQYVEVVADVKDVLTEHYMCLSNLADVVDQLEAMADAEENR